MSQEPIRDGIVVALSDENGPFDLHIGQADLDKLAATLAWSGTEHARRFDAAELRARFGLGGAAPASAEDDVPPGAGSSPTSG